MIFHTINIVLLLWKFETRLTFESETTCLSKHAGVTWAGTATTFVCSGRFWPQKSNPDHAPGSEWQKVSPVPDRNTLIFRPCSRLREAKTIPCWAAHPRIAPRGLAPTLPWHHACQNHTIGIHEDKPRLVIASKGKIFSQYLFSSTQHLQDSISKFPWTNIPIIGILQSSTICSIFFFAAILLCSSMNTLTSVSKGKNKSFIPKKIQSTLSKADTLGTKLATVRFREVSTLERVQVTWYPNLQIETSAFVWCNDHMMDRMHLF